MKKINLKPYYIGEGTNKIPYPIVSTLVNILFNKDLQLGIREAIETDKIAIKIEGAKDYVLLEDAEYTKVKKAVELIKGLARSDIEFARRVLEAEDVSVKEAPK